MSELIVFVFRDEYRAPEVLNELRRRDWDWVADLDDALAVTLNRKGKVKVQLSIDLSNKRAVASARMWGSLLAATLIAPWTDAMTEAAAQLKLASGALSNAGQNSEAITPKASWWKESLKLDDDFLRDAGAIIAEGNSAVFILLKTRDPQTALKQLRDYGGTVLRTSLSAKQDEELIRGFHLNDPEEL